MLRTFVELGLWLLAVICLAVGFFAYFFWMLGTVKL